MSDWKDTYRNLDPKQPLAADDSRLERSLYTNDFLDNVRTLLELNAGTNHKLLLSGHTGCGKSTFLNLLADDQTIQDTFHVVRYSIKDLLDVNDIDHVDLLLSIAAQALVSVSEDALRSTTRLQAKAEDLALQLKGLIEVEQETDTARTNAAGAEVGAGLAAFRFLSSRLFLRYQYEKETRDRVRRQYRANITDFLQLIDNLLNELRIHVGKPILVLIDDTDKVPPIKGKELFLTNGHHLAHPKADIVFVVDLSLATSTDYPAIRAKFSAEEFFPAVKIRDKAGEIAEACRPARATLQELVCKRIPEDEIEPDALALAIDSCGGVVRELVRLLQYAVFEARGKVRRMHVQHARLRIANEFNLYGRHTRILQHVLDDPDWLSTADSEVDEKTLLELLHMPALFQYRNGEMKWYRPYPVLIEWLRGLSRSLSE